MYAGWIDWITEFAALNIVEDKWAYLKCKVVDLINEYVPKKKPFQPKKRRMSGFHGRQLVHPTQGVEAFGKFFSPLCMLAIL